MWLPHCGVTAGLLLALIAAEAEPDCAQPAQARSQIARLRLAEIEYAEDVHRQAHWDEMGRCPPETVGTPCRSAATRRFEAIWEARRAQIEATYERMLEDYEARCRAALARGAGRPRPGPLALRELRPGPGRPSTAATPRGQAPP